MTTYRITSRAGADHGIYDGDTPREAFLAMLEEAGDTYGSETAGTEADWIIEQITSEGMIRALSGIADVRRGDGAWYIRDYAPDSTEYSDGTLPGGDWDEECDRRLAEVRAALPAGWSADWSDDDIRIDPA